jgi:hypothetical protein
MLYAILFLANVPSTHDLQITEPTKETGHIRIWGQLRNGQLIKWGYSGGLRGNNRAIRRVRAISHLSLLGSFEATLDSKSLMKFRTNKTQALLIYLAAEDTTSHQRDDLMAMLWPGLPHISAQVNLRQTIYRGARLTLIGQRMQERMQSHYF